MAAILTQASVASEEREKLFRAYANRIEMNPSFDRTLVSFQANRNEKFYNWLKYKEAFSAKLVRRLVRTYGRERGVLLDPFAGVGTSLFVARELGMDSIGVELMPIGFQAIDARLAVERVDVGAFRKKVALVGGMDWREFDDERGRLRHIPITVGAFSDQSEREISGYRNYCRSRIRNPDIRKLFELAGLAVLESASYTRKDGQYLRWDYRANKPRVKSTFDKGSVVPFSQAIANKLTTISHDLSLNGHTLFKPDESHDSNQGSVDARRGSCLKLLPMLESESIDLVVTSPPYCNRYDYTRTYALELVYLGLDANDVKRLRQDLLSCTVENRDKVEQLRVQYESLNRTDGFTHAREVFGRQHALLEVLRYLDDEAHAGRLNNANIPRMVRNYFLEMCFTIFELARLLRKGGRIVMVNDNVRYAGEEVPVDLILSDFAAKFGLTVERIWTLPRGKGNSSQQMGAHGRSELRKCVYVWSRP